MVSVSMAFGNFICVARATAEEQEIEADGSSKAFTQVK